MRARLLHAIQAEEAQQKAPRGGHRQQYRPDGEEEEEPHNVRAVGDTAGCV